LQSFALPLEHSANIVVASQRGAAHVCYLLLQDTWSHVEFKFTQHKGTDVYLVKMAEEDFEALEDNQVLVQVRQHHTALQQMQVSAAMVAGWPCCLWNVCCAFVSVCVAVIASQHSISICTTEALQELLCTDLQCCCIERTTENQRTVQPVETNQHKWWS